MGLNTIDDTLPAAGRPTPMWADELAENEIDEPHRYDGGTNYWAGLVAKF